MVSASNWPRGRRSPETHRIEDPVNGIANHHTEMKKRHVLLLLGTPLAMTIAAVAIDAAIQRHYDGMCRNRDPEEMAPEDAKLRTEALQLEQSLQDEQSRLPQILGQAAKHFYRCAYHAQWVWSGLSRVLKATTKLHVLYLYHGRDSLRSGGCNASSGHSVNGPHRREGK